MKILTIVENLMPVTREKSMLIKLVNHYNEKGYFPPNNSIINFYKGKAGRDNKQVEEKIAKILRNKIQKLDKESIAA
jgi:hypothetical protein